ncbi:MAG: 3-hydroxy-3-isohexenylglutaryl-CoA/hydroxy-methylglutaryl-CoA lyase [Rhodospirillaceae bacterium]|nr:hydroxymethylglutaryl-CoA lyase [Rhodospirillaceae bacterium]CAI8425930.1 MAG: 3-hydroxy-3-isohexenylglutaryl-CoA/hydroxy-methylglutaryl-CoA lyase [Rhodospirillaceae bacterium]
MTERVTLFEMAPRDGLQNEATMIATADKIELVDRLSRCGFSKIEVTSFVSPRWVPQLADAAEVMQGITRSAAVTYAALTPNMQGFKRAMAARADEIAVFGAASEGFSQNNINCSIAESLQRFQPVVDAARAAGVPVRGYVSCVTHCPYDGPTPPESVARVAAALIDMGCYQVSLGDTLGAATPEAISAMLDAVLAVVPVRCLAGHFHDTGGRALDNIAVSLERGLRVFDSAIAGLGGCPYAPGAKGNVATEAVVTLLHEHGFETGLDRDRLAHASAFGQSLRKGGGS